MQKGPREGLTIGKPRADMTIAPFGLLTMTSRLRLLPIVVLFACSAGLAAQTNQARVSGQITDDSGLALPGVTITLTSQTSSQQKPVEMTTETKGDYLSPWVVPGEYTITFGLAGFDSRSLGRVMLRAGETLRLDQQLSVAALKETVEVVAPFLPPPEPPKPLPLPPRPRAKPVDKEILASVCGPRQSTDFSLAVGHIAGRSDDTHRGLIGPGDLVQLDAGEDHGLADGQNLVVRRRFPTGDPYAPKKIATFGEQTAGMVQIVELRPDSAVAIVVYLCSELVAGDTVEPYQPQLAVATRTDGTPRFDEPAKIIVGEYGRTMAAAKQMMVIDQGIMQGVASGQRLTIFRRVAGDHSPTVTIGDGVIVAVRADSATFRIERATDAVTVGDLVAIHR